MTSGQKTTLALVMLFAAAAYARNKLQKIETHSGASPGVVTIKGDDFQVATGGSNGDCLVWDTSTDAGVAWDPTCGGGGLGGSVGVYEVAYGMDGGTLDSEAAFAYDPTTNTLTVDTSTLVVDGANDRVGVGDTTPDYKIEAEASTNAGLGIVATNTSSGASASSFILAQADGAWGAIQCYSTGYGPTSWGGVDIADKCWIGAWDSVQFVGNGSATPRDLYFLQNGNNATSGLIAQFIVAGAKWTFNPLSESADFEVLTDNSSQAVFVDGSANTLALGDNSLVSITLDTDGTGNGEVVLPDESIGIAEILTTARAQPQTIIGTAPVKPTCDASNNVGRIIYVDDTNDAARAMWCGCGVAADDTTYGWTDQADGTTACIGT